MSAMSHLLAVLADEGESVSWLELLLPVVGWIVLAVGVFVRSRRRPRNLSA